MDIYLSVNKEINIFIYQMKSKLISISFRYLHDLTATHASSLIIQLMHY